MKPSCCESSSASANLPIVIKIVNSEENIHAFRPPLDPMLSGGLVTLEKVKVIDYRAGKLD